MRSTQAAEPGGNAGSSARERPSRTRGGIARSCLLGCLVVLSACASPIDRAGDRADQAVTLAAEKARQIAQDATAALDGRMVALTADVAARADAARAAALVDVSARLDAQRTAILADVDRQRAETLAALRQEREALTAAMERQSAAWVAESAAWRATAERGVGEVASIRAGIAPLVAAVSGSTQPDPDRPTPAAPEDRVALWTAIGAAAFTLAKTARRLYLDHHAARADA